MTLEQFELYLHDWLKTKLNVANEKVERAYQNTQETPSYPYYTFHVESSDDETEENENFDGTLTVEKLHTAKVCIKAYSNEKYNKAMQDLKTLKEHLRYTDEVSEFNNDAVSMNAISPVISLKEEIQENEFIDMAYLEIQAMFNEIITRNDLGEYNTLEGTLETPLRYSTDTILSNEAINLTGTLQNYANDKIILSSETVNLESIVLPEIIDNTPLTPSEPIIPILQTDFDNLGFGIWLGETSMSTISGSTITGQA